MPKTADDWIWAEWTPFYAIGGWNGAADEMRRITLLSLKKYPWLHIRTAAAAFAQQMRRVDVGDGLLKNLWQVRKPLEKFMPQLLVDFERARQQKHGLTFSALNRIYIAVGLASTVLVLVALAWTVVRRQEDLTSFIAFLIVAILGNAFICGVLSNPQDRYQSRLIWLATLAIILVLLRIWPLSSKSGQKFP